jgi:hypothetical protein
MSTLRTLAVATLTLCATAAATAQTSLHLLWGNADGDRFGAAVSAAGDVNHDGYDDVVVGSPFHDTAGNDAGRAQVFSGFDGAVLWTFDGESNRDWLGYSVCGGFDIDQDGYDDLIIGEPRADSGATGAGSVLVYSGMDASLLHRWDGEDFGDELGYAVDCAGDVNADGYPDVVAGMPFDNDNSIDSGAARVYSGLDGSLLHELFGNPTRDWFGIAVSGAGDVDDDGYDDVLVGATQGFNSAGTGYARVFSGRDGSVLHSFLGDQLDDRFGISVAAAGNVDGDRFPDLVVGAALSDQNGSNSGMVRVFSGLDGRVIYEFTGDQAGDQLGWVADGRDLNGDARAELLLGANQGLGTGYIRVYSGRTGQELLTFVGSCCLHQSLGTALAFAGDVNGDGLQDLLLGDPTHVSSGATRGSARVLRGEDLWLTAQPSQVTAGETLTLTTREGLPGQPTLLLVSSINGQPQSQLIPPVALFDASSQRTVSGTVPAHLGTLAVDFQALALGPGGFLISSTIAEVLFQ